MLFLQPVSPWQEFSCQHRVDFFKLAGDKSAASARYSLLFLWALVPAHTLESWQGILVMTTPCWVWQFHRTWWGSGNLTMPALQLHSSAELHSSEKHWSITPWARMALRLQALTWRMMPIPCSAQMCWTHCHHSPNPHLAPTSMGLSSSHINSAFGGEGDAEHHGAVPPLFSGLHLPSLCSARLKWNPLITHFCRLLPNKMFKGLDTDYEGSNTAEPTSPHWHVELNWK